MLLLILAVQAMRFLPLAILMFLLLRRLLPGRRFKSWELIAIPLLAAHVFVPFFGGAASLYDVCATQCKTTALGEIEATNSVALRIDYSDERTISHVSDCRRTCTKLLTEVGLSYVELKVAGDPVKYYRFRLAENPDGPCDKAYEELARYSWPNRICLRRDEIAELSSTYLIEIFHRSIRGTFYNGGTVEWLQTEISEIPTGRILLRSRNATLRPTTLSWHSIFRFVSWGDEGISLQQDRFNPVELDYIELFATKENKG